MSIIAISGKMGSGKDTVGKLIQYHIVKKNLPSLDTSVIFEEYKQFSRILNAVSYWEIKKFAGKLKQLCSTILGCSIEDFESEEFKQKELGPEWDFESESFVESGVYSKTVNKMTVRKLMQLLGTDSFRNNVHPNIWVNSLFTDYSESDNWIITDCRFINEAQEIKRRGGIIVRVERTSGAEKVHSSENELDSWEFDHVIDNNGTIEELSEKVLAFLKKYEYC